MEYRPLDITVISASELKNVNMFMKMDVYVVVSISGQHSTKRKTYTDRSGGANPEWNYRIKFSVEEGSIPKDFIRFQLKAERSLGDKVIGEVSIPLGDLFEDSNENESSHERQAEYQVRTSSGKARGSFKFSCRFGKKFTQHIQAITPVVDIVTAQSIVEMYPPPPPESVSGGNYSHTAMGYTMQPVMVAAQYPVPPGYTYQGYGGYPPPYQYGGGYPPAAALGYVYPGQPMTYAYMPMQQLRQSDQHQSVQKKKKSRFGNKLGFGLGAGILGGLLVLEIGDMLSGVEDMVARDGDIMARILWMM